MDTLLKSKNPHAVSLGKLGGRKPGFTGKPLDPAKARAMVASRWAKYRAKQNSVLEQKTPQIP